MPQDNAKKSELPIEQMPEIEALKERLRITENKLRLQESNWIYSHSWLYPIVLGSLIGVLIGTFNYFTLMLRVGNLLGIFGAVILLLIVFFGSPLVIIVLTWVLCAPSFSLKTSIILAVSAVVTFSSWFYCIENFASSMSITDRLLRALLTGTFVHLINVGAIITSLGVAYKRGYRVFLDGSVSTYEVEAETDVLFEKLKNTTEDFGFLMQRIDKDKHTLYLTQGKVILQLILKPRNGKTLLAVTLHSIDKDVPMEGGSERLMHLSSALIAWLRAGEDWKASKIKEQAFTSEAQRVSAESFRPRGIRRPSKVMILSFARGHWKDIALLVTIILALMSWLFPR